MKKTRLLGVSDISEVDLLVSFKEGKKICFYLLLNIHDRRY